MGKKGILSGVVVRSGELKANAFNVVVWDTCRASVRGDKEELSKLIMEAVSKVMVVMGIGEGSSLHLLGRLALARVSNRVFRHLLAPVELRPMIVGVLGRT